MRYFNTDATPHLWFLVMLSLLAASGCLRVRLPEKRIVSGQSQAGLSWERAVQMALTNHPALRQARQTLEAKAHNRNQALGAYLPSVEGTLDYTRTRPTSSNAGNSLGLGFDIEQLLFTGWATTGEVIKAQREWDAARWAYAEQSATVRQQLRLAFVERLRLNQLREVNRRITHRREGNAQLLQLRYEAGREDIGSLRRAQAIAERAAFDVRQTQRQIESQSLRLGREVGGYFATEMPLEGDLEGMIPTEPQASGDYVALADSAPTVRRLVRSAEALKAAVVSSQSKLWPSVKGTFDYGYSGTRAGDLEKDDAALGLVVSMPLFSGGENVQGVLESSAEYRAAVEAARSARDERIARLSSDWTAFRDAWELVAVQRSFLEASRQRAEIVHAQYANGLVSYQDFDIAEQNLADSEKAYVQSLAEVLTREADWLFARGATLEDEVRHAQ